MTATTVLKRLSSQAPTKPGVVGPGAHRVSVARTIEDVERLRPLWSTLPVSDVDADIDHFLLVAGHAPDVLRPHVVVVERDDHRPILIVARLARQLFPVRLGYRRIATVRATALVVSFDGILGTSNDADVDLALTVLASELKAGVADLLLLQKLTGESATASALARRAPRLTATGPETVRWWLTLPNSLETMIADRPASSRARIQRQLKGFAKKYQGRAEVCSVPGDGTLSTAELRAQVAMVAKLSYQSRLQLGSVGEELTNRRLHLAAEKGWLRGSVLKIDDQPVAFWWGIAYGNVLAPGSTGFDPSFAKDGVGYVCMMRSFENLCADPSVEQMDFGYGHAEYKQRFASSSTLTRDHLVFTPRPASLLARVALGVDSLINSWTSALLNRSELVRTVKRRWRRGRNPRAEAQQDRSRAAKSSGGGQ